MSDDRHLREAWRAIVAASKHRNALLRLYRASDRRVVVTAHLSF